jgi:predicted DNA-binding protein with PD1-like motif
MKYSEASLGRVFVIRLEHGDVIPGAVEALAREKNVRAGVLVILGGADAGSRLAVGPEDGDDIQPGMPVMQQVLAGVHEGIGAGTLFPDETDRPVLHLHLACGRAASTLTGCSRGGVVVWRYMEAVLFELTNTGGRRVIDPDTGFKMLLP